MDNIDQRKTLLEDNHQLIAAIIDEQIDQDKKNFVNKLSLQEKKQAEIERIAKELKGDIKNLAQTIQDILDKHHKDYISTFSTFMDTVRRDLKLKLEQMEKIEEEKRKINDVHLIKCERDFFRAESVKFNNLNKELNARIEDMGLRMKILGDEVNNLTIKWKDSESVNKQLVIELEGNIQSHKQLEKEIYHLKDYIKALESQNQLHHGKEEQEVQVEDIVKEKYNYSIDKMKYDLKKEKAHNHKLLSELNSIFLEKNKLENIFIDCVEETRKYIFHRRLKTHIGTKGRSRDEAIKDGINTKYDSFLPADKKQILEQFVFNDEVSNVIREAMFTKPQKERVQTQNSRNILCKIDLPAVENTKDDKVGVLTNIIDHTKTTFFKTGKITVTSFHRPSTNKKLSFPLQIKR